MIYLACPYSHPDLIVRQRRYEAVTAVAAKMVAAGEHVFSPITHSHPMAMLENLPGDWSYWKAFDSAIMPICKKLIILTLPGWSASHGVIEERELALSLGLPVEYIDPP